MTYADEPFRYVSDRESAALRHREKTSRDAECSEDFATGNSPFLERLPQWVSVSLRGPQDASRLAQRSADPPRKESSRNVRPRPSSAMRTRGTRFRPTPRYCSVLLQLAHFGGRCYLAPRIQCDPRRLTTMTSILRKSLRPWAANRPTVNERAMFRWGAIPASNVWRSSESGACRRRTGSQRMSTDKSQSCCVVLRHRWTCGSQLGRAATPEDLKRLGGDPQRVSEDD